MKWSQGTWLLFVFACCVLSQVNCEFIKADLSNILERNMSELDFFYGDGCCNNTDSARPVFKLLHLDSTSLLVGSAGCACELDPNLTLTAGVNISQTAGSNCNLVIAPGDREYRCKNYIAVGEKLNDTAYYICGTNNVAAPSCQTCIKADPDLVCGPSIESRNMARNPNQNITVALSPDKSFYYIGAIRAAAGSQEAFGEVTTATGVDIIDTLNNDATWIYSPIDFVGKPIEHGNYVYFFFRERAEEYDNLGRIIYSRVARVCQNDAGGINSPLFQDYTTFLKTRLQCSVGSEVPFFFNEVQDVRQSTVDLNIVFGLFTTAAAGTSSSAICRYDLDELDRLFDLDRRRGQAAPDQVWRQQTPDPADTIARRQCSEPYPNTIYTHISNFPFVNTPALNCRTASCNNYERTSADPLAIIEGVRGQKMAIQSDSSTHLVVFIGTNNRTVYKVTASNWDNSTLATAAVMEKMTLRESPPYFTQTDLDNKWPYGVSTLEVQNDMVYGTTDGYVFMFPAGVDCTMLTSCLTCYKYQMQGCEWSSSSCSQGNPGNVDCSAFGCSDCSTGTPTVLTEIKDRSGSVMMLNFTTTITNAVVTISRLYEGPINSNLRANYTGGLEEYSCTSQGFKSRSGCREFLAVHCEIENVPDGFDGFDGVITVSSGTGLVQPKPFNVTVDVDDSAETESTLAQQINDYDLAMASYQDQFQKWVDENVTCGDPNSKSTCPAATDCVYCP